METHGIHTGGVRKEGTTKQVACSDCGHVYLVGAQESSGVCRACGNVEYLSVGAGELRSLSEGLLARRVLPRLQKAGVAVSVSRPDPLEAFRVSPDGDRVERLRIQYQVEWQLWAALVRRFEDPALHMAYLTLAMAERRLERAAERYREHRSVMAILDDGRWQAEVSDLMLARIEALAVARMPEERGWYGFDLPDFLKLLPDRSFIYKAAWFFFGLFLVAKLLRLTT